MADSKISALSDGSPLVSSDALVIARSGNNYKIPGNRMPGLELDYVQITSSVTVTPGNTTTCITGNAVTYDGSTRVKIEVYTPDLQIVQSGGEGQISLFEGSTDLGRMCEGYSGSGGEQDWTAYGVRFLTPSAASHTYLIKLKNNGSGNVQMTAGAGGTGTLMPAWYRITIA